MQTLEFNERWAVISPKGWIFFRTLNDDQNEAVRSFCQYMYGERNIDLWERCESIGYRCVRVNATFQIIE